MFPQILVTYSYKNPKISTLNFTMRAVFSGLNQKNLFQESFLLPYLWHEGINYCYAVV